MEKIKYKLTFAENGIIIKPEESAVLIYEEESDGSNPRGCKALGEEIYYYLHELMLQGDSYKYDIEISITPLK